MMNTTEEAEVLSRIRGFISQTFPLARRRNLTDDDNLLSSGVMDSLGVLEIVTLLQQDYSLEISDDELTPENFESIRSIARFVTQRVLPKADVAQQFCEKSSGIADPASSQNA